MTHNPHPPGSYGCHELMDRVSLIRDLFGATVEAHPGLMNFPEWEAASDAAGEALFRLHNLIAEKHLAAEWAPDVPDGPLSPTPTYIPIDGEQP